MSTLNYHHLRYFRAVAHEGNLTRAAERLHLSQSALSSQIGKLEDRLGLSLFERRGRRLHLTEAGRIALEHADVIFATGEELLATLSGTDRTRRLLRVGALATLSRNFQIGLLRPMLARDDVEVVLRSGGQGELLRALERLELDIVLLNRSPAPGGATPFVSHLLAEQRVSLVGTPARLADGGTLASLLSTRPVIVPAAGSGIRAGFDALVDRLEISPRIAAEVDDMAMMRLLAREDVGLAVLPPIVVEDELAAGLLVEIEASTGIVETFHAVVADRRFPNPLVRALLQGGFAAERTAPTPRPAPGCVEVSSAAPCR